MAQNLQATFRRLDSNGNGFIELTELQQALWANDLKFSQKVVAQIINMFDTDENGKISFTEFEKVMSFLTQCQKTFVRFDVNKDGSLARDEVINAIKEDGFTLQPQVLQTLVDIFDPDLTHSLCLDEYLRMMLFLACSRNAFAKADKNNLGTVQMNFNQFVTYMSNCT